MSQCKFSVNAPGKIILFGEHSVLYSQPALATAINKRTRLYFESGEDKVELDFKNLNFHLILSLNEVKNILENVTKPYQNANRFTQEEAMHDSDVLDLIQKGMEKLNGFHEFNRPQCLSLKCVFYLLYFLFHFQKLKIKSFKITVDSDLIVGAGTGSSASFCVCLSAALYQYTQFLLEPNCMVGGGFSTEQKSFINKWAFACEQIIHGKASGVDNFVCTYGSTISISFINDDQTSDVVPNFKLLDNTVTLRVLLVNSGVSRNTAKMVKTVRELNERNPSVTNVIFQAFGEITKTAVDVLTKLKNIEFETQSEEYTTLFAKLEDLVSINHGLLTSVGVSHSTLNSIIEIAASCGLKGKLTGAGGGGHAFILVPPFVVNSNLDQCKLLLKEAGFIVEDTTIGDIGLVID